MSMENKEDAVLPRASFVWPSAVTVHFDGACQPPRGGGVATYGLVVSGPGVDHREHGLAVPRGVPHATNNVAEYVAAIRGLEWLRSAGYQGRVTLQGDSQLVIRQMIGDYRVKKEHLRAYHEQLARLVQFFEEVRFEWVPREQNTEADALSKLALRGEMERRPPSTRTA